MSIDFCFSIDSVANRMTTERMAVRLRRVSERSVWRGVEETVDARMKPTIAAETLVRSLSLFSSS